MQKLKAIQPSIKIAGVIYSAVDGFYDVSEDIGLRLVACGFAEPEKKKKVEKKETVVEPTPPIAEVVEAPKEDIVEPVSTSKKKARKPVES